MTRHIIRAEIEHGESCVLVDIEYQYFPGIAERRASYSCAGEPGEGAEVEFLRATLVGNGAFNPPRAVVDELAGDWLESDHGYDRACELAEDES